MEFNKSIKYPLTLKLKSDKYKLLVDGINKSLFLNDKAENILPLDENSLSDIKVYKTQTKNKFLNNEIKNRYNFLFIETKKGERFEEQPGWNMMLKAVSINESLFPVIVIDNGKVKVQTKDFDYKTVELNEVVDIYDADNKIINNKADNKELNPEPININNSEPIKTDISKPIKSDITMETKKTSNNFTYALAGVGNLIGLYLAYKQKRNVGGYIGFILLGGLLGSITGQVIDKKIINK